MQNAQQVSLEIKKCKSKHNTKCKVLVDIVHNL